MKFLSGWILLALMLSAFHAQAARAANELADRDLMRKRFGVDTFAVASSLKNIRIAVLDNGFNGYEPGKGLLPESTELVDKLTQIPAGGTNHGLSMAQVIWGMTGKQADGPKFYLVNTNGFSNFKAAVDWVIQNKIDIVLYAQVWAFGGNYDGTGFINEQVNRAIANGAIWINAAGNYGGLIYNGRIDALRDRATGFLKFGARDHLRFESKVDENDLTLTMSWSDFRDTETYNSDKDLDFFVYDSKDQLIGSGELVQKGEAPKPGEDSKLSSHAREQVTLKVDRGQYKIKILAKTANFDAKDRFRVLIKSAKDVTFTDKNGGGEIMPPADNPKCITVGERAFSSSTGPTADGRIKPEVYIEDSTVAFTNGNSVRGSSTAAALYTAIVAVLKAHNPRISLELLRQKLKSSGGTSNESDLRAADRSFLDTWVQSALTPDSQVMFNTRYNHFTVLTQDDPFELASVKASGVRRGREDDLLVASNRKWTVVAATLRATIKAPAVVFQKRAGVAGSWKTPAPTDVSRW